MHCMYYDFCYTATRCKAMVLEVSFLLRDEICLSFMISSPSPSLCLLSHPLWLWPDIRWYILSRTRLPRSPPVPPPPSFPPPLLSPFFPSPFYYPHCISFEVHAKQEWRHLAQNFEPIYTSLRNWMFTEGETPSSLTTYSYVSHTYPYMKLSHSGKSDRLKHVNLLSLPTVS